MQSDLHIYCGDEAVPEMIRYCHTQWGAHRVDRFLLVSDENTYAVLGARAEAALEAQDWDVRTVVLTGEEVIADEEYITQVLLAAGREERPGLLVAMGETGHPAFLDLHFRLEPGVREALGDTYGEALVVFARAVRYPEEKIPAPDAEHRELRAFSYRLAEWQSFGGGRW